MSKFSFEEICEHCDHAEFHKCCGQFCHCKEYNEEFVDHNYGECEEKKETKQEWTPEKIIKREA